LRDKLLEAKKKFRKLEKELKQVRAERAPLGKSR